MPTEELNYERFEQRFRDKVRIGAGGFGTVYKVFDHAKNYYVALKVSHVKPEYQKFTLKNEVELVNRMEKHRNIARYDACYRYNTGIAGEMDFAILKFYEDGNLEQFLQKSNLSLSDKKLIIDNILRGVQFLHRNEVIHRDLKAQNILMSREDGVWCPKITDFGLSREVGGEATITNSAVGLSYAYAAPEQILNQKIYKNVDLWAIGVLIYRIVNGVLPFTGIDEISGHDAQSQFELSKKIVNVELPQAYQTMPEPYRQMVGVCLVKDPKDRVQNVEALIDLLHGNIRATENLKATNRAPHPSTDETTQILQSRHSISEEQYSIPEYHSEPALGHTDYQQPRQNVTQFVTPNTSQPQQETEPAIIPNIEGGERGKFNYRHLLIFGAIAFALVLGAAAFYGVNELNSEPLPSYEGPLTPVTELREDFADLDLSSIEANDKKKLSETMSAINREMATGLHDQNYRLNYIKAKLYVYQDEPRESFDELYKAHQIAIRTQTGRELKNDMLADEALFETFTLELAAARKKWERLLSSL